MFSANTKLKGTLYIISLDVDFRKAKEYSFLINPIGMNTGRWNGGVHATPKGSNFFGMGYKWEGSENVGPRIWTKEEDEIWDIPTIDSWLSGGLISLGWIKCIRYSEVGAVQYPDS